MENMSSESARWCYDLLVIFGMNVDGPEFYCVIFFRELGIKLFIGLSLRVLPPGYCVLVFTSQGACGKIGERPQMSNGID